MVGNMNGPPRKSVRACQLCFATTHATDECSQIDVEEVKVLVHNNGNGGDDYPKYDPNSQFNNPRWKDHGNFKWESKP